MGNVDFKAGDIVQYEHGGLDYLVEVEGEEGLFVNACNPKWVDAGRRGFCDELYPFGSEGAVRVGHYGDGDCDSARMWFTKNRESYKA